jgi:glycosyltransferase involved in cell wall biosynthesis
MEERTTMTRAIDIRLLGKRRTGDEAVFFNLTKEILAADTTHLYLLLTDEQNPQKIAVLQGRLNCVGQKNVRIVSLYGKNRFIWNLITLPWFLFTERIDTYHTQYILPFILPKRTSILLHIHDISFRIFPELIGWKDRLFLTLLIPRSLRRADRILTPSVFTRDEIVREYGVSLEKIAVIQNALSENFLVPKQSDVDLVRKKYTLPARFVLYVGTFQPRKNIPFLIRAFARLRERLPDMQLVLVGNRDGHHVDPDIEVALRESGIADRVLFPGYVAEQDLPTLLRCATVFAFPSRYEGFGIPILEAMSQEVPVAVSDIPVLREVAGEAAVYFDPTSIAQCEEKLYTLCTDSHERMSGISLGKSRISLFSWKKSAASLLAVYAALK